MRHSIGIDMGGTKIEGCIADEKGKIIFRYRTHTDADKGKTSVLKNILYVIDTLIGHNKGIKLSGIGIGIPGFTDKKGKVIFMPNVPLVGTNLKKSLEKKYRLKVSIDNDANLFAYAEYLFGAGKNASSLLGLIVGTGVGGGIIIDGNIIHGSNGGAGEVGQQVIDKRAKKIHETKNTFNSFCSGPGIVRRYKEAGGKLINPDPQDIFRSKGHPAIRVIDDEYNYLAMLLGSLTNTLSLDRIVLGGGVSNDLDPKRLLRETRRFTIRSMAKTLKIKKNKLGDSSGVLGAAMLVFSQ
ncbi:ROK family protein [Nanoarchaeota archaeon]